MQPGGVQWGAAQQGGVQWGGLQVGESQSAARGEGDALRQVGLGEVQAGVGELRLGASEGREARRQVQRQVRPGEALGGVAVLLGRLQLVEVSFWEKGVIDDMRDVLSSLPHAPLLLDLSTDRGALIVGHISRHAARIHARAAQGSPLHLHLPPRSHSPLPRPLPSPALSPPPPSPLPRPLPSPALSPPPPSPLPRPLPSPALSPPPPSPLPRPLPSPALSPPPPSPLPRPLPPPIRPPLGPSLCCWL
ncbi:unnamed protein product [Closterium sp. Yama58-4]|nr:unnamed protein product [Closterium sp. Yama58-4]